MSVIIEAISRECSPLLIADDVLKRSDALFKTRRAASLSAEGAPHYPGVRAPAPAAYAKGVAGALRAAFPARHLSVHSSFIDGTGPKA